MGRDERGIEQFCREVSPRLVASLTFFLGSRSVAEEVAQEALVKAWEKWATVGAYESPEAWVFRVAQNRASSWTRRRAAERRALTRLMAGDDGLVADPAEHQEVWEAVAALPARQRAAVALRELGGLSVRETAEALGCAEGTVKSSTAAGLARLRELLREEGT
jgi:RNA polymerase sigma factor (sigma-70 family)